MVRAPVKNPLAGIEQLAEVAAPHRLGRHGRGIGVEREVVDPLLRAEEEEPVPAADRSAPGRRTRSRTACSRTAPGRCSRPGWCCGCASRCWPAATRRGRKNDPLPRVAVAAALGDEANLAAAGAPVLGHVVGGQHLDFLDGIDVLDADDRAGGSRAHGDGAVDRDRVLVGAAAVDVEAAVAEVVEAAAVERRRP